MNCLLGNIKNRLLKPRVKQNPEKGIVTIVMIGFSAIAFAVGLNIWMQQQQETVLLSKVQKQAIYISSVANAVRSYVSQNNAAVLAMTAASPSMIGTDWLKAGTGVNQCAGVINTNSIGFLPCEFAIRDAFDNQPTTIMGSEQLITGTGSPTAAMGRTIYDPILLRGKLRMDMAERVMDFAEGVGTPSSSATSLNSFVNLSLETNQTAGQRGRIYASSLITTVGAEIYLRVDGTNNMLASLNMNDGVTDHDIVGAGNATFSGSVTGGDVLTTAGRTLKTVSIIEDVIPMTNGMIGLTPASIAVVDIVALGFVCDPGLAMKIFANPVAYGNDAVSNGWITYATQIPPAPAAPTSFTIITQLHTTSWIASQAAPFPTYVQYRLRCM